MRVLLVQPPSSQDVNVYELPIGLMSIASILEQAGNEVAISIPSRLEEIPSGYDAVGISSTTPEINSAKRVRDFIKNREDVPVIMGGVHPTLRPLEVLEKYGADCVVVGEGENAILKALDSPKTPIIYGDAVNDLDSLPFPAYHLVVDQIERFAKRFNKWYDAKYCTSICSRGCPFNCLYCAVKVTMGRKWRSYTPKRVEELLQYLNLEFGITGMLFKDSTFTLNRAWTENVCKEIRGLGVEWMCGSRVDCVSKELLETMKDAGCRRVVFGVETGNPDLLWKLKRVKVSRVKEIFAACKSVGIEAEANWLIGTPWESEETIQDTLKLMKEIKPVYNDCFAFSPLPGSEIYDHCVSSGLFQEPDDWGELSYSGFSMPTHHLTLERLRELYREVVEKSRMEEYKSQMLY